MNIANRFQDPWHSLSPIGRVLTPRKGGSDPEPRDLYKETADELRAKVDLAPKILAAEQQYRPQYAALEMQQLEALLNGTQARSGVEDYQDIETGWRNKRTGKWTKSLPNDPYVNPDDFERASRSVTRSRSVNMPAQRGLLSILEEDLMPASDRLTAGSLSRQRESEIADVERLGSRATAAYRAANPEQAALTAELNRQAQEELEMGASLDPSLRRELAQSVRAGQAARGFGFGQNDLAEEALFTGTQAEQLRQSRKAFAMGVAGLNQATSMDPFLATLGRPGINLAQSNQLLGGGHGIGRGAGPSLFGTSIDANDVFNTNFNAASAAAISDRNNAAATQGAAIAGGAALAGSVAIAL